MEKINIVELLRDCPKGMELDSTMYENLYFDGIDETQMHWYPIKCYTVIPGLRTSLTFSKFGEPNRITTAKCVIFPKGKTTWEGFVPPCQFKDGDVVVAEDDESFQLFLLKHLTHIEDDNSYDGYCYFGWNFECNELFEKGNWGFNRLATETEKEKLFDAIKANGYKWNENTKSLEKINKPNFKNGDVLESGIGNLVLFSHTKNSFGKDIVYFHCILTPLGKLEIREDCGVGGTEDCTLASDKQKERLFKALNEAGYNWDAGTKTLIHNEDNFKITLKLFEQLYSQQIEGVKSEDIPNKIAELLSKALKKKIEVKGDGIKTDISIKIENL